MMYMNDATIGSEEYKDAVKAVEKAQNQLANVTKLGVPLHFRRI